MPRLPAPSLALTSLALAVLAMLPGCSGRSAPPPVSELVKPRPVFLLGFDGLQPELVARYEKEGLLPNFARLRREGAVGAVRSTIPMISPPAWTTVATGVRPGEHGIWSFWIPEGDDPRGRYVDATRRLAPAIWQDLALLGRTVGIVNVPITCPPDSVLGFMIAGFPYPEGAPLTWPPDLEEEIGRKGYLRDAFRGPPVPGEEETWLDHTLEVGRVRREIGLDLLFDRRPDLSFIVFTTPDRIQHHLWKLHDPDHPHHRADASDRLKNAVRASYVWCDDILEEVLEKLPADAVLLVLSDHGFGPAYRGISKARLLSELPEAQRALGATTRNLFGGDFYLGGVSTEERSAFVEAIANVTDARGNPLTRAVHDARKDALRGYGEELGPEVVAEEAEGYLFVPGDSGGPLVRPLAPMSFSGYHRREGYFAALGPPIVPGPVRTVDLRDVPALAIHVLGERIPRRYVHNIPRKIFPLTYFVERPMVFSGTPKEGLLRPGDLTGDRPGSDAGIEEQLRSLGYVQ